MDPRRLKVPARLGIEAVGAFAAELERINADPSVSVLVLEGGEEAFCSGLDTDQLLEAPDEGVRRTAVEGYQAILRAIRLGPKPTVAAVNAPVQGGGVGIVAACDFVLATERATFAFPEALFGLIPAMVLPLALERMRPQQARLWAIEASARSAEEALSAGLVDKLVPVDRLERAVTRAVRQMGRTRPAGVAQLMEFTARARQLPLVDALREGGELTLEASGDEKVKKALASFREYGVFDWDEEDEG